jgi:hypothetical protein
MLGGAGAVASARCSLLRTDCVACERECDEGGSGAVSVRLVCDSCAAQYHPRCLRPPLRAGKLPKGFWLCPRCERGDSARALAWSLDGCALCAHAPRGAAARAAATFARGAWRIVADDELAAADGEALGAAEATHAGLIARTNCAVDRFNAALRATSVSDDNRPLDALF